MSKLINTTKWKEFKYETLFTIERGKGPRINNITTGSTPFITATETNNGLTTYVDFPAVHKGNCITVNRNGSIAQAFYQTNDFCSTEDVHIFYLKPFILNKNIALFLITLIKKEKYRFGYGRKWGIERMKKSTIKLPTDSNGNPDWEYMENYIKELWEAKIPNLNEFRKSKNKVKIELKPILEWKEFEIKDIFNLKNSKPYHLDKLETELEELDSHLKIIKVNYVTRTRENNGILKKFKVPETFSINNGNVISITAEGVYAFYQAKKFITGNKVYILSPKSFVLTPYIGAFIISILNFKILDKYSYSRARIGSKILNEKIKLPVDSNENPDWEYMENYIKSLPYSNKI